MTSLRTASLGVNNAENLTESDNAKSSPSFPPVSSGKEASPKKPGSLSDFTVDVNDVDVSKGGLTPNPVNMERLVSEVRYLGLLLMQLHVRCLRILDNKPSLCCLL